jgi:hypothetical protein
LNDVGAVSNTGALGTMNANWEFLGIIALAGAGAAAGWACSRLRCRLWIAGYLLPLASLVLIGIGWRHAWLEMRPPFSWLMAGWRECWVAAVALPMMLACVAPRLRHKADRRAVMLIIPVAVLKFAVWPLASSSLALPELAGLPTRLDADGVCLQSTDYTCGPAAAVTALRRLGFSADEGELAISCRTSGANGTEPDVLCEVLRERYGAAGLRCELQSFDSAQQLRGATPCLVVVKFNNWFDHYVTVLEAGDTSAVIADPLAGKTLTTLDELSRQWRRVGLVLSRE